MVGCATLIIPRSLTTWTSNSSRFNTAPTCWHAAIPSRSIGNVVRAALFADGHINVVPLLLGGTVGVLLQRLLAFKLHDDDVFVALGKLHFDRLRPNIFNTWIVDVLCRSYRLLDLFGRGTCLPLDGDHMNHRLGLVGRVRCETCGYNGKQ